MVHICDGDRAVEATELGSAGHVHLSTPFGIHICCARRDDQMWFSPLANSDGLERVDASDKVFSFGAGSERFRYSSVSFRVVADGDNDSETVADDDDVADQGEANPVDYDALKFVALFCFFFRGRGVGGVFRWYCAWGGGGMWPCTLPMSYSWLISTTHTRAHTQKRCENVCRPPGWWRGCRQ